MIAKINYTICSEFRTWYEKQNTYAKPPFDAFVNMNLRFTIGVYLDFIKSKDLLPIVTTIGYKIRRYNIEEFKIPYDGFLNETLFPAENYPTDIIEAYGKAIEKCLAMIDLPF